MNKEKSAEDENFFWILLRLIFYVYLFFSETSLISSRIIFTPLCCPDFSMASIYFWRFSYTEKTVSVSNLVVRFSSSITSLNPCFLNEFAFNIWSPRLAFAERGMRIEGFLSADISHMAFAPALYIMISDIAKRSLSSSLMYSNCLYPSVFSSEESIFPFPHR